MSRAARLGAFIVVTLAILVAGIFIIGGKQYLFSSTYRLKAQFDNVVGLDAGADVRVGGVHSGTVRDIVLPHKPGDKVTVVMDLGKSTHEIIKQDSVATIETEGLLGNQYLAISFGSAGSADVRDGDTIASQPPLEMSDLLKRRAAFWIAASRPSRTPLGRRRIWTRSAPRSMRAGNRRSAGERQTAL
jgi:phospholipid/cholesterol/gamma-HCH transport system substrate-binding protein